MGLFGGLHQLMCVECFAQCLVHGACSMGISWHFYHPLGLYEPCWFKPDVSWMPPCSCICVQIGGGVTSQFL